MTDSSQALIQYYITKYQLDKLFSDGKMPIFELITYQRGSILLNENQLSDYIYILVEGVVKVYRYSSKGKILYIARMEAMQILGETASLWGFLPSANVQAQSKVICLGINLSKYQDFLLNDATWLRYISHKMATRIKLNNTHFSNIIQTSLTARLATLIINNAKDNVYDISLTETAEFLGASYRHLLRCLYFHYEQGTLKKEGRKLVVLNLKKLIEISESFDE
jgi:CRP/FNR family transcriptional regulator, putaive post-exponential-phase nitrogen-starvation regulator